ncbi:MAG: hypothetical protein ACTSYB_13540, partial [Candidatus Helarchaeota archaeon]
MIFFALFLVLNFLVSANLIDQNTYTSRRNVNDADNVLLSSASWSLNGVVISNEALSQTDADVCSDGAGGVIIVWRDYRSSVNKIYAQRLNATGHTMWTANGVLVASTSYAQESPQLCSDGQGGAIIVWCDYRPPGSTSSIYAQRLNADGERQWGSSGVAVYHSSTRWQTEPRIVSDGANGSIIIWRHNDGTGNDYIYGQRLNETGNAQWGLIKQVYTSGDTNTIQMCSDGASGAYITWSYGHIYAQRLNSAGNRYWASAGVTICDASGTQDKPQIIKDGTNCAVIVWHDYRVGSWDVYAQRIDGTGTVQWKTNGVEISVTSLNQQYPQLCSDGANGSIITWQDARNSNWDIYAQRINDSGQVYWTTNGIPIATTSATQQYPSICSDGVGGAIIAWQQGDIYAQRINKTGHLQWLANGAGICTAAGDQRSPIIYSDGAEGAYIVWEDRRSDSWYDLYAYRAMIPTDPILQPITPSID